jgi:hypothetical protein
MKKAALFIITLILISCGASSPKKSVANSLYEVLTQQADGGASIRFFEILSDEKDVAK